ncbi:hypothetical protein IV203_014126 [Nitzschia inconspicua]|uniref:Uncharacterized protein n=1 Tax=Nitzschia inconspicua TaxID=303405 RepID=A0A9K3M9M7_9STRA|nr:hypothetical protein IV203_014126 [Nitzschia inconspicua]
MNRSSFDYVEINNQGCKLLNQQRNPRLAVGFFRTIISRFRQALQVQIETEGSSVRSTSAASTKLLPLTLEGLCVLKHSLAYNMDDRPSEDRKSHPQQSFVLHETGFGMSTDLCFSHHEMINAQFHMAMILFNLGLCFHLMGRQQQKLTPSRRTSSGGFVKARSLYCQALELLQECLNDSSCCDHSTSNGPQATGNELVDLLLLALLNNTAIVCCIDLGQHTHHSCHEIDARNMAFVQYFSIFVDVVKENQQHRLMSSPSGLDLFHRNAHKLCNLFFRGSVAAAA